MKHLVRLAIALSAFAAVPALAHPKVTAASPAAGAAVASPKEITLQMSEKLMPKLSGATLTMTSMPGMADHGPMKVAVATTIGGDGKTIILKPAKKLPAGTYLVEWHAVTADTHRITGKHEFAVK